MSILKSKHIQHLSFNCP